MNFLEKCIKAKKKQIMKSKSGRFAKALRHGRRCIIAEIKMKSPTAGKLIEKGKIPAIMRAYNKYASAISVVTEKQFFNGSLELLDFVREKTGLPILCKDFIIDESQLFEIKAHKADAALLIARLLSAKKLSKFVELCKKLGIEPVVEVHSVNEMKKALACGAKIIGINNRDLCSLTVDIKRTNKIMAHFKSPELGGKTIISESGFGNIAGIKSIDKRVRAFLIGSSILKSGNYRKILRGMKE